MYNTSYVCTYMQSDGNEQYQKDLLNVFNIDNYDLLGKEIDSLYQSLDKTPDLIALLQKLQSTCIQWADLSTAFFVLFSFDYFHYAHPYLCELLLNQETKSYPCLFSMIEN